MSSVVKACEATGLRMTGQRRIIALVLDEAQDHPDAETILSRAQKHDGRISLATVYRTLRRFEEERIITKHEFGEEGRARYEPTPQAHHDHLIDLSTGEVIEFVDSEIEALQEKIAERLGYRLKGHRLELYGVKKR